MNDAPRRPDLSPAAARRIDRACDRFEAEWKSGSRPNPAEYLDAVGEPERSALLRQLLLLDWDYRRRAGDAPRPSDYHAQFPGEIDVIDAVGREMRRLPDDTPLAAGREPNVSERAIAGPDRYELLQEVGQGGAGVVFRARDRVLGRELAVKVLREAHRDAPEIRRRFVEEARVGSQLQHPAIVPVYELGWFDDKRPYITMKLVEGRTLAALLKDRADPGQDMPRLLGVFEQVCQAMAYAHARRVVHRDLKPANVMVGAFGEVQVMDWGFAKILGPGEPRSGVAALEEGAADPAGTPPVDGPTGASKSGVVMGTPAYMPPEQARGQAALTDARADVFALGAILCEILTGRPPYGGGPIMEVCRKAAEGDLADAHARLDACGADGPLTELTRQCLTADRAARPLDAGVVARDLAAYLASVQERLQQAQLDRAAEEARTVEARAKARAERRARRLTVALAVAAVLLLATAGAGWWQRDRVQQAQAFQAAAVDGKVETALAEADACLGRNDWTRAGAAANRARELLASGATDRWKPRVEELAANLDLAARIEAARRIAFEYDPTTRSFPLDEALTHYADAFGGCGVAVGADPAEAAARITQRPTPVRDALTAGLEDWWLVARGRDEPAHEWLATLLKLLDPDPWRGSMRAAAEQRDKRELEDLAATNAAAVQPPETVTALARALLKSHAYDAAVALLRPAQQRFPADFWINLQLGHALFLRRPPDYAEALRFYSIAGALRPEPSVVYTVNLAGLLTKRKDWDGAILAARKAIELQPSFAEAYNQLGVGLENKGVWQEAQTAYRNALEQKPDLVEAHYNLGLLLERHESVDRALPELERAVQLAPRDVESRKALGHAHALRNEFGAALAAFDKAIELKPGFAAAYGERGEVLLQMGRLDDAVAAFEKAIRLDPTMDATYDALGQAYRRQRRFDRAVAAGSRAVELAPQSTIHNYNLGNALKAASDLPGAAAAYREAVRLDPNNAEAHCNLGMVLKEQGQFAEALAEIMESDRLGTLQANWRYPSGQWVKDAQRLVALESKLPGVLDGTEKPATTSEQIEYAGLCKVTNRVSASARLYAAALSAEPALVKSPEAGHRYRAACVAAQAGGGQGADAAKLDASERARWRRQALDWLRADLTAWAEGPDGSPADRSRVVAALQRWRSEKALAAIREPENLARLPASERAGFVRLWADVQDVLVQRLSGPQGN